MPWHRPKQGNEDVGLLDASVRRHHCREGDSIFERYMTFSHKCVISNLS